MNKKFLALAVAAASISTAASAATVYKDDTSTLNIGGRVEVRGNISSANKSDSDDNKYEDASRVRLNIGGEQKLNDDISFIGFTEFELTENDSNETDDLSTNTRYLYAGITSQRFGALTYGHQDTSFTYITNWTDRAENFTGDINEYNAATSDRADNVLRYALSVDRLTIQAHVQADSNADGSNTPTNGSDNGTDGYGVIAAYKLTDALEIGAGWAQTDGSAPISGLDINGNPTNIGGDNQDSGDNYTYTGAIKYVQGGVWVAVTYEGGKLSRNDNDQTDFNAVDAFAGYTFGDNNINMSYNYLDADEDSFKSINENNLNLEYARYFGHNVTAFASYRINLLSDGDASTQATDDQAMLGLRYAF